MIPPLYEMEKESENMEEQGWTYQYKNKTYACTIFQPIVHHSYVVVV